MTLIRLTAMLLAVPAMLSAQSINDAAIALNHDALFGFLETR